MGGKRQAVGLVIGQEPSSLPTLGCCRGLSHFRQTHPLKMPSPPRWPLSGELCWLSEQQQLPALPVHLIKNSPGATNKGPQSSSLFFPRHIWLRWGRGGTAQHGSYRVSPSVTWGFFRTRMSSNRMITSWAPQISFLPTLSG